MAKRVGVLFRRAEKFPPYEAALRRAGLEPVRMQVDAPGGIASVDGLCLTGGTDVDPALYGQARGPETDVPDSGRDKVEAGLLREALGRDIPVLCICRGMQLFNVVCGGTLTQHLRLPLAAHKQRGVEDAHGAVVEAGTRLAEWIEPGAMRVNSRHHQAVDRVGEGLVVSARAEDGVIEGLELPGRRFAIGVQWHPEDRVERWPRDLRLFEALARAIGG